MEGEEAQLYIVSYLHCVCHSQDCYNVVRLGADGTGATSGILNAPSPAVRVQEMAEAIVKAYKERTE